MTIILPEVYHAKPALVSNNINCISAKDANRQDIRPLRIGILNIMSNIRTYEFNLLYPLGKSILQITPVWIKLSTYHYEAASQEHLDDIYSSFKKTVSDRPLDGLIITGAPVEELDFDALDYWEEVHSIAEYARKNVTSTLGIGWGAMALAKTIGIDKERLEQKVFGVFETRNLWPGHPITGDLDDVFRCPHSRHSGYADTLLEAERDKGNLNLLAHSREIGYVIFETTDRRFLMHLGHPEYNSGRLIEESLRDQARQPGQAAEPAHFNPEKPINCWRSHRNEFFSQWIKFIYMETSYDWTAGSASP